VAEDSDYYRVLGLNPDASEHEIEGAYRRFLGEYFRDGSPSLEAQHHLETMSEAYAVLIDPEKRAAYDERVGIARTPQRRRHGFHLGLDVGIARVTVGIGQVDGPVTVGSAGERGDSRY
jgi:DnaJ-class molecular chaperone